MLMPLCMLMGDGCRRHFAMFRAIADAMIISRVDAYTRDFAPITLLYFAASYGDACLR